MENKVLVLMSTYNGEKYLREQLDSILEQRNVDISILIRDDGSCDNTIDIIKEYQNKYSKIELYCEKNVGYAMSFWNLIKKAKTEFDYYAFCDQDDIWLKDKIFAATKMIEKNKKDEEAILYTSRVISINNNKEIINENTFNTSRVINVYESLQRSIIPGCVFVFNRKALEILKKYDGFMESHDWATYCIINTLGKVIYDENSYIHYRIHGNNAIGIENKWSVFKKRVKRFFGKSKCVRSIFAKDFYNIYREDISEEYLDSIKQLAYYKEKLKNKFGLLFNRNYRGVVFKIYIVLNRV